MFKISKKEELSESITLFEIEAEDIEEPEEVVERITGKEAEPEDMVTPSKSIFWDDLRDEIVSKRKKRRKGEDKNQLSLGF